MAEHLLLPELNFEKSQRLWLLPEMQLLHEDLNSDYCYHSIFPINSYSWIHWGFTKRICIFFLLTAKNKADLQQITALSEKEIST